MGKTEEEKKKTNNSMAIYLILLRWGFGSYGDFGGYLLRPQQAFIKWGRFAELTSSDPHQCIMAISLSLSLSLSLVLISSFFDPSLATFGSQLRDGGCVS